MRSIYSYLVTTVYLSVLYFVTIDNYHLSAETGFLVFYISNYTLKFAEMWENYNEKHRNNGFKRKLFQTITDYFIRFELLFTVSNYLTHLALDYSNSVRLSSATLNLKKETF